eukprot:14013867-Ditylum_brightwellii.AAC.1
MDSCNFNTINTTTVDSDIHPQFKNYYDIIHEDKTDIPDTGCSHHTGNLCTPGINKEQTYEGPKVHIPNGGTMQATHKCELNIPDVSPAAKHTNLYP